MNTFVYLCDIDFPFEEGEITPSRREEILSCKDARVKREKGAVFALLRLALFHALELRIEDTDLKKLPSGKWVCSKCFFSLSHSREGAAVAVSLKDVGIDRAEADDRRFTQRLYEKITTPNERVFYGAHPEKTTVAALWTKKESLFKKEGGSAYLPFKIDTTGRACTTFYRNNAVVSVAGGEGNITVFVVTNQNGIVQIERVQSVFSEEEER